jgi:hypothetical protein
MSGMKPMSSMRSASSMTMTSTPVSSSLPRSEVIEQAARRGDQHVDAARDLGVLVGEGHAADEQRDVELLVRLPYLSKLSSTCAASSRVGSRMSVRGMRARARPREARSSAARRRRSCRCRSGRCRECRGSSGFQGSPALGSASACCSRLPSPRGAFRRRGRDRRR